jgi:hypothetical protein
MSSKGGTHATAITYAWLSKPTTVQRVPGKHETLRRTSVFDRRTICVGSRCKALDRPKGFGSFFQSRAVSAKSSAVSRSTLSPMEEETSRYRDGHGRSKDIRVQRWTAIPAPLPRPAVLISIRVNPSKARGSCDRESPIRRTVECRSARSVSPSSDRARARVPLPRANRRAD